MIRQANQYQGHAIMLVYAVLTAVSATFIHDVNQQVNPIVSTFFTFSICIIAYSLLSSWDRLFLAKLWRYKFEYAMLNVTTAVCWILTFLSLKTLPPYLYLFVYLCAMPVSASVIYRQECLRAIILITGLLMVIPAARIEAYWSGLLLALAGGTSGTVYSIYSRKMAGEFTSMQILSMRFYLTVIIAGIYCYLSSQVMVMPHAFYLTFLLLSIVSVLVPLYLFQAGLARLNLSVALAWLPLAPILCYIFSAFTGQLVFQVVQVCAVILLGVAMLSCGRVNMSGFLLSFSHAKAWEKNAERIIS